MDLRANVQGQSLSPLDLLWIQRCPGAIELLQSVLNTIQTSKKSLFSSSVLTNCCGAVIFGLSKNYLSFEMSLKCTELFLGNLDVRKHLMFLVKNLSKL